jgi:hypothetical protein
MLHWNRVKGWLRDGKSARRAVRRQDSCRPLLELLEDRTVPSTITAVSGSSFSTTSLICTGVAVATFNVQGAGEPAANFSASIDWGDQTSPGQANALKYTSSGMNQFVVRASHTYAQTGTYSISVSIRHESESPVTATTVGHIGTGQVLYTASYYSGAIYAIDSSGNASTFANTASTLAITGQNPLEGIAIDAQGDVYVAAFSANKIEEYSPSGQDLGAFAQTSSPGDNGLAFDSQGNLYVGNYYGTIEKYSPSGQDLGAFASTAIGIYGLVFDSQGNLFESNAYTGNLTWIKEFSPTGQFLGTLADSSLPTGMCFDPQGNLYALNGNGTIARFAPNGQYLGVFATTSGAGSFCGLAFDAAGNLYASEFYSGAIEKFDSSGHSLGFFATGLNAPNWFAFGAAPGANLAPKTSTSITSSSLANTSTYGDAVTFTATVTNTSTSAAPAGHLEFFDDSQDLGAGTPVSSNGNSSTWTFTTSALNAGSHDVKAFFVSPFDFNDSGADLMQSVNPRVLNVTFTGSDKVYDGTTAASVSYSDDAINGDTVGLTYSAGFSDKNVGAGKVVNVTGIALSSGPVADYVLASTTAVATASITSRPLTITATGIDKVYDGTTAASVTLSDDRISGDDLSDSYTSASFADANVGTGKPVTAVGIGVSGTDAGNYSLQDSTATTTANITRAGVTISVSPYSVTYDGDSHTATGSVTGVGGVLLSGLDFSGTMHTTAGTYTDSWTFTDPTANYASASGTVTDAIAPAGTSVSLTSSTNPSVVGQDVTFTATVHNTSTSPVPTGTVTFTDTTTNTVLASNVALDGYGKAAVSTSALAVGSHTITAVYANADGNFSSPASTSATQIVNIAVIASSSLSGLVFEDFNDDGQVDFGEAGIAGVQITLTGTDDLGHGVSLTQTTDGDGAYVFAGLRPGSYYLTRTSQPAGYTPGIDTVGSAGGSLSAVDQFFVQLSAGVDGENYNYGERPAAGGSVQQGQAAGIGFWNNRNGQALIKALNGGGTDGHGSHQLGDWLAATLPRIFGVNASNNNLTGKNNADVAALFQQDFLLHGVKLDAQLLATALNVYATSAALDSTGIATQYGFAVSGDGVGTATVNVGANGDAFGVANNTTMTVMDLLLAADNQAINGLLYGGNTTKRNEANNVFSAVNQAGGI